MAKVIFVALLLPCFTKADASQASSCVVDRSALNGKNSIKLPDAYATMKSDDVPWCYNDHKRNSNKAACEGAYLQYPDGHVRVCEYTKGECRNAKVTLPCQSCVVDRSALNGKKSIKLPDAYATMKSDDVPWCYNDHKRNSNKATCEGAYLQYPDGHVRVCEYTNGECRNAPVMLPCQESRCVVDRSALNGKKSIKLPDAYATMKPDDVPWCYNDHKRNSNKAACVGAYLQYPDGHVRVCEYTKGECRNAKVMLPCQGAGAFAMLELGALQPEGVSSSLQIFVVAAIAGAASASFAMVTASFATRQRTWTPQPLLG